VDPFVPEFTDRLSQINAFEQILAGQLRRTTFLIKGEAEIGKSFLLGQIWHMAGQKLKARLDFRDGEVHTFLSIILGAIEDLGRQAFTTTLASIHKITQETRHDISIRVESIHGADDASGEVDIRGKDVTIDGDVIGRDLYKNNFFLPPTEGKLQRQALEQQISSAFFDDLRSLAQDQLVVLSYDSYDSASLEAQQWLTGVLLDEIAHERLPGVIVIVAGRAVPDVPNLLVPYSVTTDLGNFDLEQAIEYFRHRGLDAEVLKTIYAETNGHPKRLAEKANEAGGKPLQYQILEI
jgi:hypothetical protein